MILIAIEGIDGSGKSMQFELLAQHLEKLGKTYISMSFPRYETFIGREIGNMLSGRFDDARADRVDAKSMALWYAADRRQAFDGLSIEADYCLLNRYTLANAVYQGLRVAESARKDFVSWVFELEHSHFRLPRPDFYVVLDVDTAISAQNVKKKGHRDYVGDCADVYERKAEFLEQVRKAYLEFGGELPNSTVVRCAPDGVLLAPDEIHRRILAAVGL